MNDGMNGQGDAYPDGEIESESQTREVGDGEG